MSPKGRGGLRAAGPELWAKATFGLIAEGPIIMCVGSGRMEAVPHASSLWYVKRALPSSFPDGFRKLTTTATPVSLSQLDFPINLSHFVDDSTLGNVSV